MDPLLRETGRRQEAHTDTQETRRSRPGAVPLERPRSSIPETTIEWTVEGSVSQVHTGRLCRFRRLAARQVDGDEYMASSRGIHANDAAESLSPAESPHREPPSRAPAESPHREPDPSKRHLHAVISIHMTRSPSRLYHSHLSYVFWKAK